MHSIKLPQVADMISCAQAEKNKTDERKYNATDDVATGFFCSGQCSTDSVYAGTVVSVKVINVVPSETKSLTKEN